MTMPTASAISTGMAMPWADEQRRLPGMVMPFCLAHICRTMPTGHG